MTTTPLAPEQASHADHTAIPLRHRTPPPAQASPASGDHSPLLRLSISRPDPTVAVVHVTGEIDADSAPQLRALLDTSPEQAVGHLLLDLSDVTFLGAAGLSALIAAQRRADSLRQTFALVTGPHCVDRALQIAGLQPHFTCHRSLRKALRACLPRFEDDANAMVPEVAITAIVGSDGRNVEVLTSYPVWHGLQLHSLARQAQYLCTVCDRPRETTMAATHEIPAGVDALVCPGCYAEVTATSTPGSER